MSVSLVVTLELASCRTMGNYQVPERRVCNRKQKDRKVIGDSLLPLLRRGLWENHSHPRQLRNAVYVPCRPEEERAVVIEKVYVQCVIKWS
jgi:hypothetical protein